MSKLKPSMFGKKLGSHYYFHIQLLTHQPHDVQQKIEDAIKLTGLELDDDFNIIKFDINSDQLSLLSYPDFWDAPFPSLQVSWTVNLAANTVKLRRYSESLNPPILHRKELFIPSDDPHIPQYEALTQSAEALGLFNNTKIIGFKLAWHNLIKQQGYYIDGHQLLPLGNNETDTPKTDDDNHDIEVMRHRTAMTRYNLSAPMQALARFGFLDGRKTLFDYGCGKGDDLNNLAANDIQASGWDPYFATDNEKTPAHIVNLGFVINVIESFDERIAALQSAYSLANELLVVSAMLYNQNSFKGQEYQDGVLTTRNTFQKYYTQNELKDFIEEVTGADAIAVGPGIFFVFSNQEVEQAFLLGRQRSRSNYLRLTRPQKPYQEPKVSKRAELHQKRLEVIKPIQEQWLMLGRKPHSKELTIAVDEVFNYFKTVPQLLRFVEEITDADVLEKAYQNRLNDLSVYFSLLVFKQNKTKKQLDDSLQRDIKVFFGNYQQALNQGRDLLFQLADTDLIDKHCKASAEYGIGFYDAQDFYVPSQDVERLNPILRVYIACAAMLYGDVNSADLVKIHITTGKLSLMRYDDFYGKALPKLLERVKIKFRELDFDYYRYDGLYSPPYLYHKSRYLNEDSEGFAEQLAFDEQLSTLIDIGDQGYGLPPATFDKQLAECRWEVENMTLIRSQSIPNLDTPCGEYLTYRNLIECGETWHSQAIENDPKEPDTYTALYDLANNILDPVIDYFGGIKLSYGFCSAALAKQIPGRIAPKLDQHACHELNRLSNPICPRLGAAVDFIVEDEDMREVAEWIAENTPFDRLYYYGKDKPIHISYGPEHKREYVEMREGKSGRLVPYVRRDITKYETS